ncbi:hypothetical protein [uncultured Thiothrix sp.]|uniref:hypothetical protein n=1 Tax=uncultured Thiothrix sp. TaxID=223185 RepID=UPI002623D4F5|nr:hypothetical protein [uncultured Thiothrix sp.]
MNRFLIFISALVFSLNSFAGISCEMKDETAKPWSQFMFTLGKKASVHERKFAEKKEASNPDVTMVNYQAVPGCIDVPFDANEDYSFISIKCPNGVSAQLTRKSSLQKEIYVTNGVEVILTFSGEIIRNGKKIPFVCY